MAKGRDNFINIRSFATEVFGACKSQSAFEAQESIARAQDLDRMEKLGRDFRIASCAQRIVCNLLEFGIAFDTPSQLRQIQLTVRYRIVRCGVDVQIQSA